MVSSITYLKFRNNFFKLLYFLFIRKLILSERLNLIICRLKLPLQLTYPLNTNKQFLLQLFFYLLQLYLKLLIFFNETSNFPLQPISSKLLPISTFFNSPLPITRPLLQVSFPFRNYPLQFLFQLNVLSHLFGKFLVGILAKHTLVADILFVHFEHKSQSLSSCSKRPQICTVFHPQGQFQLLVNQLFQIASLSHYKLTITTYSNHKGLSLPIIINQLHFQKQSFNGEKIFPKNIQQLDKRYQFII